MYQQQKAKEFGLEYWTMIDIYINSTNVEIMLRKLKRNGNNALAITDNASYFTAREVK